MFPMLFNPKYHWSTLDLKWLIKTFPAVIATYILGGDFNSYLNMNLREKHGWTYGASTVIGQVNMFQKNRPLL
jgi:predicted Zn-dependent peptidase